MIAEIDRSDLVSEAEDMHKTVMEAFPDSTAAEQYKALADKIAELCGMGEENDKRERHKYNEGGFSCAF